MSADDIHFCASVYYFWTEKGDPERFGGWDVERCAKLMPDFLYAWQQSERYRRMANDAIRRELPEEAQP